MLQPSEIRSGRSAKSKNPEQDGLWRGEYPFFANTGWVQATAAPSQPAFPRFPKSGMILDFRSSGCDPADSSALGVAWPRNKMYMHIYDSSPQRNLGARGDPKEQKGKVQGSAEGLDPTEFTENQGVVKIGSIYELKFAGAIFRLDRLAKSAPMNADQGGDARGSAGKSRLPGSANRTVGIGTRTRTRNPKFTPNRKRVRMGPVQEGEET